MRSSRKSTELTLNFKEYYYNSNKIQYKPEIIILMILNGQIWGIGT